MKKFISVLLLAVLVVASCRNKEQLGPNLVVSIQQSLAVSNSSVDFSAGEKIYFTAKFEKEVAWKITITGSNGITKKYFTGTSSEINASNSTWKGTTDVLPSFTAGSVTATLTFSNDPQTQSVPVNIVAPRNADYPTDVLVTDFVVNKQHCYCAPPIPATDWPSDFPATVNTENAYGLPDGNAYLVMGPQAPWQNGSPYVDILTISPNNSMVNYGTYYPLYADPTRVYFNIMVYNTGTPTWLQITLFEEGTAARVLNIKPNWTGWKQISVRYSDLTASSSATAANVQPDKVTAIQLVLLSNTAIAALPGPAVKTAFDHITFTHNAPYQP